MRDGRRLASSALAGLHSWRPLGLAGACAILLAACGGRPPSPPSPVVMAPVPPPSAPAPPSLPPPDLSAVPEPSNLGALVRLGRPTTLLRLLSGSSGPVDARAVTRMISPELGDKIFDLDQPIDLATTGDDWALSIAVPSLDQARTQLPRRSKLVAADNGWLYIQDLFDVNDFSGAKSHAHTCALAPSAGPAATRLVCATNVATLAALGPYLTRTVARGAATADLRVEAHRPQGAGARHWLLGRLVDGLLPEPDDIWDTVLRMFAEEVGDFDADVDALTLEARIEDGSVEVSVKLGFAGATSQTVRALLDHPERDGAPPADFWRLPLDTDIALFGRGLDEQRISRAREVVLKAYAVAFERSGMPDAERPPLMAAFKALLTTPAPVLLAHGVDFQVAKQGIDAMGTSAGTEAVRLRARDASVGWWIERLDEPAARVQAAMADLAHAWARPGFLKWWTRYDPLAPTVRLEPVPTALKLPARTAHLVLGAPAKSGALHVFAVPDDRRTWLVLGMDAAQLVDRVHGLFGEPSRMLASRIGLEGMKALRASGGAFVTLRGLETTRPGVFGDFEKAEAKRRYRQVERLGDLAATPLFGTWSSAAATADAPAGSFVAKASLPRGVVEGLKLLDLVSP